MSDKELSMLDLPMRRWEDIEPEAIAWAKSWYSTILRNELKAEYGKGARLLSDIELRNRLVKRFVRFSLDRWSQDLSAGRKVV